MTFVSEQMNYALNLDNAMDCRQNVIVSQIYSDVDQESYSRFGSKVLNNNARAVNTCICVCIYL